MSVTTSTSGNAAASSGPDRAARQPVTTRRAPSWRAWASCEDRLDRLLARGLDERTGVHDHEVGLIDARCRFVAVSEQRSGELGRVDLVLRTPECLYPVAADHRRSLPTVRFHDAERGPAPNPGDNLARGARPLRRCRGGHRSDRRFSRVWKRSIRRIEARSRRRPQRSRSPPGPSALRRSNRPGASANESCGSMKRCRESEPGMVFTSFKNSSSPSERKSIRATPRIRNASTQANAAARRRSATSSETLAGSSRAAACIPTPPTYLSL